MFEPARTGRRFRLGDVVAFAEAYVASSPTETSPWEAEQGATGHAGSAALMLAELAPGLLWLQERMLRHMHSQEALLVHTLPVFHQLRSWPEGPDEVGDWTVFVGRTQNRFLVGPLVSRERRAVEAGVLDWLSRRMKRLRPDRVRTPDERITDRTNGVGAESLEDAGEDAVRSQWGAGVPSVVHEVLAEHRSAPMLMGAVALRIAVHNLCESERVPGVLDGAIRAPWTVREIVAAALSAETAAKLLEADNSKGSVHVTGWRKTAAAWVSAERVRFPRGRPKVLGFTPAEKVGMVAVYDAAKVEEADASFQRVAAALGVHRTTVIRIAKEVRAAASSATSAPTGAEGRGESALPRRTQSRPPLAEAAVAAAPQDAPAAALAPPSTPRARSTHVDDPEDAEVRWGSLSSRAECVHLPGGVRVPLCTLERMCEADTRRVIQMDLAAQAARAAARGVTCG